MGLNARVTAICGLTLLAGCITEDVVPEMVTVAKPTYMREQAHTICYGAGVQAMEFGRQYLPVGAPTYNTNCQAGAFGGSFSCNSRPSSSFWCLVCSRCQQRRWYAQPSSRASRLQSLPGTGGLSAEELELEHQPHGRPIRGGCPEFC